MLIKWSPYNLERSLFDWDVFPKYQNPLTDINEDGENTYIEMELPGISIEDVEINVENQILMVKGERKVENKKKYFKSERQYGLFQRSFALSDTSSIEDIDAVFDKGILRIRIPKKPSEIPKKIPIKVS